MGKYALLLLPLALLLLVGCPGWAQNQENATQNATRAIVSPITIVEEKETIVTGESSIITNNTNASYNKTVPDYTYAPDATLFIYFINATFISDWTANASNERQGEAILIKKGDADILIDSGTRETSTYLVNFLKERGVDDIELFVSTHARPENYGGMDAVLGNFEVEQFMWNQDDGGDAAYAALVRKAINRSIKTIPSKYLMEFGINGINFQVLNPLDGSSRFFMIDNDGIVFKITDRDFCLMTTGDIAYGAQAKIANSGDFSPRCKILQIPNYGLGAGTSNIDIFLLKVAPESAVITGSYFDPALERYTIDEKLRLKGIKEYKTFSGSRTSVLRISTNGTAYAISTQ